MKLIKLLLLVLLFELSAADWWESASYYQIYPRSFKDSNGDGIGDLRGIADNLAYLKELGITATWLSPIYKSPLIDYGYDISDFYAIGPEYGTMADFEYLMTKSNETGVKVLMDFVPNHTSDEHEWFVKSVNGEEPFKDYYVWHPGKADPNNSTRRLPPCNWQAIGYGGPGDAWTWNDQRKAFYYHQFAVKQPDLNFRNPKVHDEMKKVLKFWLDKGVAGFRVDAITHMYELAAAADNSLPDEPVSGNTNDTSDYQYLRHIYTTDQNETFELVYEWREYLDQYVKEKGGQTKILMTESYSPVATVQRYYTNGTHEGAQLPFNFELSKQLTKDSTAHNVVTAVHSWLDPMPKGHFTNWVMGNHDGSRLATRMGGDKVDLYNALVTILPGTSVTYYGEEIGMTDVCVTINSTTNEYLRCPTNGTAPFIREFCRSPMQWDATANAGFNNGTKTWLPVSTNFKTVNVAYQKGANGSHLEIFKHLMRLRKTEAGVSGVLTIESLSNDVLMIQRVLSDKKKESIVAFFNFGNSSASLKAINETHYPNEVKIELTRLNSLYKTGSKVKTKEIQLGPNDLLVATFNSATTLALSSFLVLLTLVLRL